MSRSGYYNWKKKLPPTLTEDDKLILKVFKEKKGKFGIRRLKMHIYRHHSEKFNLKKIIRIKKKLGLITLLRRPSKYSSFLRSKEVHREIPNLLCRRFKPDFGEVLLSTDVTELRYGNGQKAYLSAVQNLGSKEIMNFCVMPTPQVEMVMAGIDQMLNSISKDKKIVLHSDQGFQYTSHIYRSKLKEYGVTQSMSRRGNCLDNAPIESFFGHLKDEAEYKECKNFNALDKKIKNYINYYNKERPQWGLKQKTPAEAGGEFSLFY